MRNIENKIKEKIKELKEKQYTTDETDKLVTEFDTDIDILSIYNDYIEETKKYQGNLYICLDEYLTDIEIVYIKDEDVENKEEY